MRAPELIYKAFSLKLRPGGGVKLREADKENSMEGKCVAFREFFLYFQNHPTRWNSQLKRPLNKWVAFYIISVRNLKNSFDDWLKSNLFSPASPSRTWGNKLSSKFSVHLLLNCGMWLLCNKATYAALPWGQISNSRVFSALSQTVGLPVTAVGALPVCVGKHTALCVTVRLLWHRAWKRECGCESLRRRCCWQRHTRGGANGSREK